MKLAVISPESHDPREISVVRALLSAGLERYDLRKPSWSAAEMETWLHHFSSAERARMVIHGHAHLVERWGLAGAHERDGGPVEKKSFTSSGLRSRACHDLDTLRLSLAHYDAVLLSPIFASLSKPGHGPSDKIDFTQLGWLLRNRTPEHRRTAIFALGGIDETTTKACGRMGFDGVAMLGAIWHGSDPIEAFERLAHECESTASAPVFPRHPIMGLTQDGLALSPIEQATRLCAAGARWIQLRMKEADALVWQSTAETIAEICRKNRAIFIVNDSVDIALHCGADGVHLGKHDVGWMEARRKLGPDRLIGGTVNNALDASRARSIGCLDYVGIGPWRFTSNKKNLAPVLGKEGVRDLVASLDGLPAWAIGGIEAADLPAVRATGAAGVAVSSALYRNGEVERNFQTFSAGWPDSPSIDRPLI